MRRRQRRGGLALLLAALFVFGTVLALRTLRAADALPAAAPGLAEPPAPPGVREPAAGSGPSYDLHAFYYAWYGSPRFEGRYLHWDHALVPHWDPKVSASYPRGRHRPPDDIGSSFYPALGPYSSRDPAVVDEHMGQLRAAAIGKHRHAPQPGPVPAAPRDAQFGPPAPHRAGSASRDTAAAAATAHCPRPSHSRQHRTALRGSSTAQST